MNPKSKLWLCKTNLENDYKNSLTFATKNAQRNYFVGDPEDISSHGVSTKMYTEYTYLRIENTIKVDDFIENIDTNNYLVILNNNKYYYYFITSMEYVDEETTRIHIELDVIQTYYFDINYTNTFVEREHVTDDVAGNHTIPENLETGEYVVGSSGNIEVNNTFDSWSVVMSVNLDDDLFPSQGAFYIGGIFSGTQYISFPMDDVLISQAPVFIRCLNSARKIDAITSIFMYPTFLLDTESYSFTFGSTVVQCNKLKSSQSSDNLSIPIGTKPTTLGSYTPRNKKLLTGDYTYLLTDNCVGGTKKYTFEDFEVSSSSQNKIWFDCESLCVPSGSVIFIPRKYKKADKNLLESFACGKFPMCSWSSDPYTNWLTQTGVNRSFNYAMSGLETLTGAGLGALGLMTGNIPLALYGGGTMLQGVSSGIDEIKTNLVNKREHQIAPNELHGNESLGDVIYAYQNTIPKYYYMHIKEEYAKVIDKYFDMFGYEVDTVKTPSIHTRTYWNYLKTKNCNFTGDIPQEYMMKIKKIFDCGITFWHDPSKMFDYTQTNSVIS